MTTTVRAWGAAAADRPLAPMTISRRAVGPRDVAIEILFCGVCHSDIHQARGEWGGELFPMVPGHEIVGRVTSVGASVTRHRVGDRVGVGCLVDSCRICRSCAAGDEPFCEKRPALTYNGTEMDRKTPTFGGYATDVVVDEHFVVKIPDALDLAAAAPLLCAGITTYAPLREWGVKAGDRVAIVGLGGLGHVAVKIAASLGAEVTVLSTSAGKAADAQRLGARDVAVTKDPATFQKLAGRFDFILDTVSASHDVDAYLRLLRPRGTMVLVGAPNTPTPIDAFSLLGGNKRLAGSMIGGLAETQRMLDHCGAHGIVADVEIIGIDRINEAYERMLRSDVRYRFVIDLASLRG